MTVKRFNFAGGFTLVEVMVAMTILTIAALSALGYQYYAAGHARIAQAQITATRTAQLLLEDWRSTGGSEDYDPTTLGVGFTSVLSIPAAEVSQGTPLATTPYNITVNDVPMLIMLYWEDIAYDSVAEVTLRQLTVTVIGGQGEDYTDVNLGQIVSGHLTLEPAISSGLVAPITMTTYIRLDASGG